MASGTIQDADLGCYMQRAVVDEERDHDAHRLEELVEADEQAADPTRRVLQDVVGAIMVAPPSPSPSDEAAMPALAQSPIRAITPTRDIRPQRGRLTVRRSKAGEAAIGERLQQACR